MYSKTTFFAYILSGIVFIVTFLVVAISYYNTEQYLSALVTLLIASVFAWGAIMDIKSNETFWRKDKDQE